MWLFTDYRVEWVLKVYEVVLGASTRLFEEQLLLCTRFGDQDVLKVDGVGSSASALIRRGLGGVILF